MKVGYKVKVIELLNTDMKDTNLHIGDVGVIESLTVYGLNTVCFVRFGDHFVCDTRSENLSKSGLYTILGYQLEIIKGGTSS